MRALWRPCIPFALLCFQLELYPSPGCFSALIGVLYFHHFRYEIGNLYDSGVGSSAGEDYMEGGRALPDGVDYVVYGKEAVGLWHCLLRPSITMS